MREPAILARPMDEAPIEKIVPEEDFRDLLAEKGAPFFRACAAPGGSPWTKRRFFDLSVAADELESVLDDYRARTNASFSALTEIVASLRVFALAGMSLAHLGQRIGSYGVLDGDSTGIREDLTAALRFVEAKVRGLMGALLDEGRLRGVTDLKRGEGEAPEDRSSRRFRLPHDIDLDRIEDEEQRIAEVAARFVEAAEVLSAAGIRRIDDPEQREAFLREVCTEEVARVWESTVHNLQSSYDTHVKNTLLETGDPRLPRLRGYIAAALHSLEAVTFLTHFTLRYDRGLRSDLADEVLQQVAPRVEVRDVTLNRLLVRARGFMEEGARIASELVPSYTTASEARLTLASGIYLHARPASLIVAVVQRHGTPVEFEVGGERCNAGSILELMMAVGSNPDAREFIARGDERPLRDLIALFAADLGENGLDALPEGLRYLGDRA